MDTDAILQLLGTWEPLVTDPASDGKPTTIIEFPDRLLLIPNSAARFFHAAPLATSAETKPLVARCQRLAR